MSQRHVYNIDTDVTDRLVKLRVDAQRAQRELRKAQRAHKRLSAHIAKITGQIRAQRGR